MKQEELKKLAERNRKELQEEYNRGQFYGASANVTSYERQLTSSQSHQSRSKQNSGHGDNTCARGHNHMSRDQENRQQNAEETKRIQMGLRYNVSLMKL